MCFLRLVPLVLALVVVTSACASGGDAAPAPTRQEPSPRSTQEKKTAETLPVVDVAGGKALFISKACIGCHTVQGMHEAKGKVGPELTHQASKSLIAGSLPNTEENLKKFLKDPIRAKPGTLMPNQNLTDSEVEALAVFLRTMK
ncbi:MAG: cytochrome c [Chloroflexi bacterium]|nr:cytochrome c [Chloroflexota bacterium]